MAVIETVAESASTSELEAISPAWPKVAASSQKWRPLLIPALASGVMHAAIVCLLAIIQLQLVPDELLPEYDWQKNVTYAIDIDANWRALEEPGRTVMLFDELLPRSPQRQHAQFRSTSSKQEPLEQPRTTADGETPIPQTAAAKLDSGGGPAEVLPPEYVTTFNNHIFPIFHVKCGQCHSTENPTFGKVIPKGGLALNSVAAILKGGELGPALVPGMPKTGTLHQVVVESEMPPKGKPQLTAAEKQLILNWIKTGQPGDATAAAAAPGGQAAPQTPGSSGQTAVPAAKALEKEAKYQGKVTAETEGVSVTVSGAQGNMTFQFEQETTIVAAGDPRFFPYKGNLDGLNVTVFYYQKNGKNFARLISVGGRDVPR